MILLLYISPKCRQRERGQKIPQIKLTSFVNGWREEQGPALQCILKMFRCVAVVCYCVVIPRVAARFMAASLEVVRRQNLYIHNKFTSVTNNYTI